MKKQWQVCPRDAIRPQWAAPFVSMNTKGQINLTRFTHELLKEAESFVLLYDSPTNTIGLNPASIRTPNAFPSKPRGKCGGRMIRAFRLLQEFGLEIPESIRFVRPEIDEEGILNLDLRTARPNPRARKR